MISNTPFTAVSIGLFSGGFFLSFICAHVFVHELKVRGVALKATEQPIDTSTAAGKCFLDMLGVFAEFETAIRRERQLEGVKRAKAEGAYRGRKPSIDRRKLAHLKAQGLGATEIARAMGVDRASVYRILKLELSLSS
jgi:DNA invertase Pin-like site-specific DNA recombinase